MHVALDAQALGDRRPDLRDADEVAGLQANTSRGRGAQVDVEHHPLTLAVDALDHGHRGIGVGPRATGEAQQRIGVGLAIGAPKLVDRRAPHGAGDRDGGADRRHEDHVTRHQAHIAARVAAQQQAVEVERRDGCAVALELDVAQRAHGADATARHERVRHGGQAAHRVGAGLARLAEDEHLHRAQGAHRHARLHADHLLGDLLLDQRARILEAHARHAERADLRQRQLAVAIDLQREAAVLRAHEVDAQAVARAQQVVGGYRRVRHRREVARCGIEQRIAEGRERLAATGRQGQQRDLHVRAREHALGAQAQPGLLLGEAGQRDGRHAGHLQLAVGVELVGIAVHDRLERRRPAHPLGGLGSDAEREQHGVARCKRRRWWRQDRGTGHCRPTVTTLSRCRRGRRLGSARGTAVFTALHRLEQRLPLLRRQRHQHLQVGLCGCRRRGHREG